MSNSCVVLVEALHRAGERRSRRPPDAPGDSGDDGGRIVWNHSQTLLGGRLQSKGVSALNRTPAHDLC